MSKTFVETFHSEQDVLNKIEDLKLQGYKENDMYVVARDKDELSLVRGRTDADIEAVEGNWWDKFKAFVSGDSSVREAFDRMGMEKQDAERYYDEVRNGAFLLYADNAYADENDDFVSPAAGGLDPDSHADHKVSGTNFTNEQKNTHTSAAEGAGRPLAEQTDQNTAGVDHDRALGDRDRYVDPNIDNPEQTQPVNDSREDLIRAEEQKTQSHSNHKDAAAADQHDEEPGEYRAPDDRGKIFEPSEHDKQQYGGGQGDEEFSPDAVDAGTPRGQVRPDQPNYQGDPSGKHRHEEVEPPEEHGGADNNRRVVDGQESVWVDKSQSNSDKQVEAQADSKGRLRGQEDISEQNPNDHAHQEHPGEESELRDRDRAKPSHDPTLDKEEKERRLLMEENHFRNKDRL